MFPNLSIENSTLELKLIYKLEKYFWIDIR